MIYKELINTSPLLILTAFTLLNLLLIAFLRKDKIVIFSSSVVSLILTILFSVLYFENFGYNFNNTIYSGGLSNLSYILFGSIGLFVIISSRNYISRLNVNFNEFYVLINFSIIGMMLLSASRDFLVTFIGLEIMSLAFYILAGFNRKILINNESSLKYFLLGAFTSGIFLYGIALIYGATKTTNLIPITQNFPYLISNPIFVLGLFFLLAGFSFKVAAAPFQMWVPDVYEGAPTLITALMSSGGKAAAFFALVISFFGATYTKEQYDPFTNIIALISVASMLYGSIIALSQTSIKRMLAYSSIAHAGYMMIGFAAASKTGYEAILFYVLVYSILNVGVFVLISLFENEDYLLVKISDFSGLGTKNIYLASLFSIFLFALAGLPPFGSFFAKYFIFYSAVRVDLTWLAILGVISSIISVYVYLKVIIIMFFNNEKSNLKIHSGIFENFVIVFSAFFVLLIGLTPYTYLKILIRLFS